MQSWQLESEERKEEMEREVKRREEKVGRERLSFCVHLAVIGICNE
jgi:hypothetical protein